MSHAIDIHPVHDVYDGVFNSYSGRKVNIINPTAEMICLVDIAKGLSHVCRFGGQIHTHSSVARHTVLVWWLAPEHLKRAALLHDASEAYLGDVIKPLKVLLASVYGPIEDNFTRVIFKKYGVPVAQMEELKKYDWKAVELEHAYFRRDNQELMRVYNDINKAIGHNFPYTQLLNLLRAEFGSNEY
jgi:hypothetical protein